MSRLSICALVILTFGCGKDEPEPLPEQPLLAPGEACDPNRLPAAQTEDPEDDKDPQPVCAEGLACEPTQGTTLMDTDVFDQLNVNYSKRIWTACARKEIPMIYASSAATYGDGNLGFDDNHENIHLLKPLNPYGDSKQQFDLWALDQDEKPPFWVGCKFFNVYGPNEYHKGRMASVIFHTYHQIRNTGGMKLFKSHRSDYADGHQSRDFIYVKDILDIITFFIQHPSTCKRYI